MRRPNFVILGQGKAGTSLIWRVMRDHPDIAFPEQKELHFFNKGLQKGLAWYDAHFADLPQDAPYIAEVSPSYLDPTAVKQIAETLGTDIKVGFVLRRPVEQAFSRYMQNLCARPEPYDFERYDDFMAGLLRRIVDSIGLCHSLFGAENVLPMFYEADISSGAFEHRILDHLGLPLTNNAAAFLDGPPVNPGTRPHYIHADQTPVVVHSGGMTFEIPPNTLVFCAQKRNSKVIENPDAVAVQNAMDCEAAWTTQVSEETYAELQTRRVLPAAERLEELYGYDLAHWRNPPQALSYEPARPPMRFAVR